MSKGRLSSHERSSRGPAVAGGGDVQRYLGLSLSGGKADKACLAIVEYYPRHKKVFLSKLVEKIKNDENISADLKIHEHVDHLRDSVRFLALDVPWKLPACLTCQLKCPGYENCTVPHIEWMWNYFKARNKKKKPRKIFTPYTQRAVEMHLASELEEPFSLNHAMGANSAPLLARAKFIQRRLGLPTVEVSPRVTLWRVGRALGVMKSHLRFHRHAVSGDESRRVFLKSLADHGAVFLYDQDLKLMVENNHAFEAFLCAFTAFLKDHGATEPRPKGFPPEEDWIEIPKETIRWKEL